MSRLPPEWPQPPKPHSAGNSRPRDASDPATQSTTDWLPTRDPCDADDENDDHLEQSVVVDFPKRSSDKRWK